MAKKDKNTFKSVKAGSSTSSMDFLKEGTDFLTDIENDEEDSELVTAEDFNDPELSDFTDEDEDDEYVIEEVAEEVKEVKTGKVTVISRKFPVKKNETEKPEVEKEVKKLVKDLASDISENEINGLLGISTGQRDQILTGEMQFLGRKNITLDEKKEFFARLDEITSTEDVSKANSAFVLKWLKNRNKT
jgi:hypothetical protein